MGTASNFKACGSHFLFIQRARQESEIFLWVSLLPTGRLITLKQSNMKKETMIAVHNVTAKAENYLIISALITTGVKLLSSVILDALNKRKKSK